MVNSLTSSGRFFETKEDICCDNINLKICPTGIPTNILSAYIGDMQLQVEELSRVVGAHSWSIFFSLVVLWL